LIDCPGQAGSGGVEHRGPIAFRTAWPAAAAPALFATLARQAFKDEKRVAEKRARALQRFKTCRLIKISELPDGTTKIEITARGKTLLLRYKFDDMKLPPIEPWDKKWRIVLYDLPKRYQIASQALSKKLHELGAYQLQKSVWVSPVEFYKELEFICAIFGIPNDYIQYFTSPEIPNEKTLRVFFGLA